MPMASVSAGHYEPDGTGDGRKLCVNLYSEPNENDPQRPMRHVVRPGSLKRDAGVLVNTPRGLAQTDGHAGGKALVVDGDTVRTFDPSDNSWGTLTGTVAGTDHAQMTFSEVEGAVLADGKIYVSDGSALAGVSNSDSGTHDGADNASVLTDSTKTWTVDEWVGYTITNTTDGSSGTITANDATTITATLSGGTDDDWDASDAYTIGNSFTTLLGDHSVTAFTSIASIGQRLLFTFGSRFGYSTTLDFGETTTLNFYTAESSPDALIAVATLQGSIYLFGTETIERWVETGSNDSPFRPQTSSVMNRGCLARDTIAQLDNTLFFVGDDYAVYRLNGLTPVIVSKPWVARALRLENASDLVASYMELEGHSFYILSGVNGCYVYDVMSQEWFIWKTQAQDTWEWSQTIEAAGNHYSISRLNARFVQLSREYTSDYKATATSIGNEIIFEWTAHLPVISGRRAIPSIRVDGTKGEGAYNDGQTAGEISMALSKNGGKSTGNYRSRSTGKQGEYETRTIWRQNGRAREPQVVAFFRSNDPMHINAVVVGED